MRIVARLGDAKQLAGTGLEGEIFVLAIEAQVQPPPVQRLEAGPGFHAMDIAHERIGPHQWESDDRRGLDVLQVVVNVVEYRDRQRNPFKQLPTVTDLISSDLFGQKIEISGEESRRT